MTTTDIFGKITTDRGIYFLYGNGFTDGSETELKIQDMANALVSVGEHLAGQRITSIGIQCTDGSICTTLKLYGKDSGVVASWRGNERTVSSLRWNLMIHGLTIPMEKGMILKINTAD